MKKEYWVLIVVVVVVLLIVFRNKITGLFEKNTKPSTDNAPAAQPVALDNNKTLFKGVIGANAEVKKLQQLLGELDDDGDFGNKTEQRLLYRKGVTQTTLNIYLQLADIEHGSSGSWDDNGGTGTDFSGSFSSMFHNGVSGAINWLTS